MVLWAMAVVIGAALGLATRGSLSNLANAPGRAWPSLALAVALEASLGALPAWVRPTVAVAACLAVVVWCTCNRSAGWAGTVAQGALGLGILLNASVMALDGGMPVSRPALALAGLSRSMDIARGDLYKHVAMTAGSKLAFLGDTVPLRLLHTVLSPGDLLMLAGTAAVTWTATRQTGLASVRLAKLASRTPSAEGGLSTSA